MIEKIQQTFTETQQHLFVASFYSYLNYHHTDDFVINLREVWNWLGFSRIEHCKVVLVKHFVENEDYIIKFYEGGDVKLAPATSGAVLQKQNSGQNKEEIFKKKNSNECVLFEFLFSEIILQNEY